MKNRFKLLSFLLVVCMLLGVLPVHAATIVDSGICGDNVTWTLDSDGLLTISGSGKMTNYSLYYGKSSSPAPWNSSGANSNRIKMIVIKNSVTSIGSNAFYGCTGLTSVTIPNSVTSVGYAAFEGCTSLTSVTIPNSVTSIGGFAFEGCEELTSVTIPNSVTSIEFYAFNGCTGLIDVIIPNSVTSIGSCAFDNTAWYNEKPDGLIYAGKLVYQYKGTMPNNTTVNIKPGTLGIAGASFYGCTGLTSVTIPNSVMSIGDQAFDSCTGLTSVTIPNSVTSIGNYAFRGCTGLTSVTIPNSVTSIGSSVFEDCTGMTSVMIPNSVTSIGDSAFEGCTGLTCVTIPDSVTRIENFTFSDCTWLTSVTIPNSVKSIGYCAFYKCTRLLSVAIPNSVTSIEDSAFNYCILQHVYYSGSKKDWNKIAIEGFNTELSFATKHYNSIGPTVAYDANGGTGAPEEQTVLLGADSTISTITPKKDCTITYNASGGSVSAVSKNLNAVFQNWNTMQNGAGTSYLPGNEYKILNDITLYAQWTDPKAGDLPTPTRVGYVFAGWYTAASGGIEINKDSTITGNITLYAQWTPCSHQWSSGVVTQEPTCTTAGEKTFTCTVCKAIKTETISATGHSYGAWTMLNDTQHQRVCKNDKTHVLTEKHAWDGGKITVQPTVTAAGERTYTCTVCNGTRIEKLYLAAYNANGGSGAPVGQTKTQGKALTLSSTKPTKTYKLTYNGNGDSMSITSKSVSATFNNWNTRQDGSGTAYAPGASYTKDISVTLYAQWTNPKAGELPTPTRSGYIFAGWYTAASGGTKITKGTVITKSQTLYAHWTALPKNTYVITYNANGGTGTPASQTKTEGKALALSTAKPSKTYLLSYNAAGGKVSPASKSVSVPFKNWNTKIDGTGTAYAPGGTYSKDASATLYAQWSTPKAGPLATPTRYGYSFAGWYTAASGGTKITDDSVITGSRTLYAHWTAVPEKNLYDLGEETYSFENYGDSDSPFGHCFGMSMTSAGYYMGNLDVGDIGISSCQKLHTVTLTPKVKAPICLYQSIQGHYQVDAIVAGGKFYSNGYKWNYNVAEDWNAVLAYVKNHAYDNRGSLQVGIRNEEGGHAVNFLRYAKVDGQDRIYVYDNNFPENESYLYLTEQGVMEAPVATFGKPVRCIVLRDVATYFELAKYYDASRVLYCAKDQLTVEGATFSYMEGSVDGTEYVMYELPEDTRKVTIKPLADNADFIYMDVEYSFGEITDETYGVFRLADMREGAVVQEAQFTIYNGSAPAPSLPGDVSGDGEVTAEDARLALRAAVGLETYAEGSAEFLAADASHDGEITSEDARLILRAAVGLETLS